MPDYGRNIDAQAHAERQLAGQQAVASQQYPGFVGGTPTLTVHNVLDRQNDALDALDATFGELASRLGTVLRPSLPTDSSGMKAPMPNTSGTNVTHRVSDNNTRIERLAGVVAVLMSRLEL
jgi:hypothetical protein